MSRHQSRILWTCAALSLFVATPVMAQEDDDDAEDVSNSEFDALIARASERFEEEDFEGAIADFKSAYALNPSSNILYNIGRIYEKTGKFEEAIEYYERFVNEPDIQIEARRDALERVKALREVLDLRNGPRDGKGDGNGDIEDPQKAERKRGPLPALFLVAGGLSLAGSGATALLTRNTFAEFESAETLEERRSLGNRGGTLAITSDSLLVAGVVLTTVGVVLFATSGGEKEASASKVTIAPVVGRGRAGVGMHLRF